MDRTNLHVLAMALLLSASACSSSELTDLTAPDTASGHVAPWTVHYVARVQNAGNDGTRATLTPVKQYVFATGDALYVEGAGANADKIWGVLTLKDGDEGKSSEVTFEGDLSCATGFEPTDDTPLTATLVSTEDAIHRLNGANDRIVSTLYPVTAMTATLAEAVERYSDMTGAGTYGSQSFGLSQSTSFLNFNVTFSDGTAADAVVPVTIVNDGSTLRTGSLTTVDDGGNIKGSLVAAVPGGTTLYDASLMLGTRVPIEFGGTKTLAANMIYNVTKNYSRETASISYAVTSVAKSYPDVVFTHELTNTGDGLITYSSSAEDVATVNPVTGAVTVNGTGVATITATVTDGTNYSYDVHTASFTVTVYAPVPLASVTDSQLGWAIGADGNVYKTSSGATANGSTAVAMVAYWGAAGTADASSAAFRGLAIALDDAEYEGSTNMQWYTSINGKCADYQGTTMSGHNGRLTGVANTATLAAGCGSSHVHAAALAAKNYAVNISSFTNSGWFLPTLAQWKLCFRAFGVNTDAWSSWSYCPDNSGLKTSDAGNYCADNYTAVTTPFSELGSTLSDSYWTVSEEPYGDAVYIRFNQDNGIYSSTQPKTRSIYAVRPFFAF